MSRPSLLLVEDDAELAALLARKLRRAEIDVVWAADAEAATEALRIATFDAVWSDWELGGPSTGVDVLAAAAALLPRARLLLVTGAARPQGLPARAMVLDKKDLPEVLRLVITELGRPPS